MAPPYRTDWPPPDASERRRAAALLLLYPTSSGLTTALTVRQSGLPHHASQVSLPGGSLLAGETAQDAALREAHEEIGLPTHASEIIGGLSPVWIPVSNFLLLPFVALTTTRPAFVADVREVAAVLEPSVSWLRDPRALTWTTREHHGRETRCPGFDVEGHIVWGATAMVLAELAALWDSGDVAASPAASSDASDGVS